MTTWTLIRANLLRKVTRTALTALSLAVAFMLFMLLRAIVAAFQGGASSPGEDRLVVDSKYSLTDNLPLAYVTTIEGLDQIDAVAHMTWFGGFYRRPENTFAIYAVDAEPYFNVMGEQRIAASVLERFVASRVAAVASESLARRFGWRAGDEIPIQSDIFPMADNSNGWRFELAGIFQQGEHEADTELLLFHYDYFNEAVAPWARNQVGWIVARVKDPSDLEAAIAAIDGRFENSGYPTRSTPEDAYRRQFAKQLGDIGQITTMILGAVFFTIALVTGNTVSQAFRERIPDLAVMKTLGFSAPRVSLLVFGETVVLCLCGAAAGIGAAWLLAPQMNADLGAFVGRFEMTATTTGQALGLAALLGAAIGAHVAWRALKLPIVTALRQ